MTLSAIVCRMASIGASMVAAAFAVAVPSPISFAQENDRTSVETYIRKLAHPDATCSKNQLYSGCCIGNGCDNLTRQYSYEVSYNFRQKKWHLKTFHFASNPVLAEFPLKAMRTFLRDKGFTAQQTEECFESGSFDPPIGFNRLKKVSIQTGTTVVSCTRYYDDNNLQGVWIQAQMDGSF